MYRSVMRSTIIIKQVEGIPEPYNAHCLSIKDIFQGQWDKALLVRMCVRACLYSWVV